jgi:hypothetical protein
MSCIKLHLNGVLMLIVIRIRTRKFFCWETSGRFYFDFKFLKVTCAIFSCEHSKFAFIKIYILKLHRYFLIIVHLYYTHSPAVSCAGFVYLVSVLRLKKRCKASQARSQTFPRFIKNFSNIQSVECVSDKRAKKCVCGRKLATMNGAHSRLIYKQKS